MSYWSVVQTESQREHIARLLLMRDGYETYAPRIKLKRGRIARLFPTYIFVRIGRWLPTDYGEKVYDEQWYRVLWTPGVLRVLMSGERPAALPEQILENIRKREVGGFVRLPPKYPRRGQKLKIVRGPFEGHLALHEGMSGPERQRVLLTLMGQTVTVELRTRDVVPLNVAF